MITASHSLVSAKTLLYTLDIYYQRITKLSQRVYVERMGTFTENVRRQNNVLSITLLDIFFSGEGEVREFMDVYGGKGIIPGYFGICDIPRTATI